MRPAAPRALLAALVLIAGVLLLLLSMASTAGADSDGSGSPDAGDMTDEEYDDIYGSGEGDYCRIVGADFMEYLRNLESLAGSEILHATLRRSFDYYMHSTSSGGANNATEIPGDGDDPGRDDDDDDDDDAEDSYSFPDGPLPECVILSADDFRRLRPVFVADRVGDLLAIARSVTHPLTSALLYTYLYLTNSTAVDTRLEGYCAGARARRIEALARAWNDTADAPERAPVGLAPATVEDICGTGDPRAACERIVEQINDLRATVEMVADAVCIAHDVVLGVVRTLVLAISPAPAAGNGTVVDPPPPPDGGDGGGGGGGDDHHRHHEDGAQSLAAQMASAARRGAVRTILSAAPPGTTPHRAHFYDRAAGAPRRQEVRQTPAAAHPRALSEVLTEAAREAVAEFSNLTLVRQVAPRARDIWARMRSRPMGALSDWLPSMRRMHVAYGHRVHDFAARAHALWDAPARDGKSSASSPTTPSAGARARSSLLATAAHRVWDAAAGATASIRDELLFQSESFDLAYRAAYVMRHSARALHDARVSPGDARAVGHFSRFYNTAAHRATEALRAEIAGRGASAAGAQRFVDSDDFFWGDDDDDDSDDIEGRSGGYGNSDAAGRAFFIFGSSDDPGYGGNAPNENNLFRWTRPGDYVTYAVRTIDWVLCIGEDRAGCRFCLPEWPSSRYGCRSTEFAHLPQFDAEYLPPNDGEGWDCADYVGPIAVGRNLFYMLTAQPLADMAQAAPALAPLLELVMHDIDGDLPRDIYYCMAHHVAALVAVGLVATGAGAVGVVLLCALRDAIRAGECTDARAVRRHLGRDMARGNRFVAKRLQRLERRDRRARDALRDIVARLNRARSSPSGASPLQDPAPVQTLLSRPAPWGGGAGQQDDASDLGGPRRRRT